MRIRIEMLAPGEGEPALKHAQRAQDALSHDHVDVHVIEMLAPGEGEPGKFGISYRTESLAAAQLFLVQANAQLAEI